MKPPHLTPSDPDYQLDLEEALEARVLAVIDEAVAAGWDGSALWHALRSLLDNLEESEQAVNELEAVIGLRKRVGDKGAQSRRLLH